MKIALVSPYDWSYPGGVRTHIEHLSAELRQRGHTVRIITAASGPKSKIVEYGVYKLGWIAPVRVNGSVARIAVTADLTGTLRRLLHHEPFDLVHLHEPLVSSLTLAMLRLAHHYHIPVVGTFHSSSNRRASTATWAYAMASPFLQSAFHRLDSAIAVSEAAERHVQRFFPGEYHIIPNGIDIDPLALPAHPPRTPDEPRTVLFLGRMEPRKGLRYLLKAIPLVREQNGQQGMPPVRFIIAGEGPQRVHFERFVQKKGWPDVVFTGYVSDSEKRRLFVEADVYCAPNTGNESQGLVLLEAMALGTPVVASDILGFRGVITAPDMGLLTPPRDAEHLAWALCHLLRDDELRARLSAGGRQRALDYSWKRVVTEIEHVYEEGQRHCQERLRLSKRSPALVRGAMTETIAGLAEPSVWHISPLEENVVE